MKGDEKRLSGAGKAVKRLGFARTRPEENSPGTVGFADDQRTPAVLVARVGVVMI
jgi:hypothetical protein